MTENESLFSLANKSAKCLMIHTYGVVFLSLVCTLNPSSHPTVASRGREGGKYLKSPRGGVAGAARRQTSRVKHP